MAGIEEEDEVDISQPNDLVAQFGEGEVSTATKSGRRFKLASPFKWGAKKTKKPKERATASSPTQSETVSSGSLNQTVSQPKLTSSNSTNNNNNNPPKNNNNNPPKNNNNNPPKNNMVINSPNTKPSFQEASLPPQSPILPTKDSGLLDCKILTRHIEVTEEPRVGDEFCNARLTLHEFSIFQGFKKDIEMFFQDNNDDFGVLYLDDVIARFLYATHAKVSESKKGLIKYLKWMKKNDVKKLRESPDAELIQRMLAANAIFLLDGLDRLNRPILLFKAKNFNPKVIPKPQLMNLIIQVMEIGMYNILEFPNFSVTIIIDLLDCTISSIDVSLMTTLLNTFSDCYPGRLGVLLFINTPWWMSGIWAVLKKGLDERQQSKIFFIRKQERKHIEYISVQQLLGYMRCPNRMLNNCFRALFPTKDAPFDESQVFVVTEQDVLPPAKAPKNSAKTIDNNDEKTPDEKENLLAQENPSQLVGPQAKSVSSPKQRLSYFVLFAVLVSFLAWYLSPILQNEVWNK